MNQSNDDAAIAQTILDYASEMFRLKNEDLDRLDGKASNYLAVAGVVAGLVTLGIENIPNPSHLSTVQAIIAWILVVSTALTLFLLVLTFHFSLKVFRAAVHKYPSHVDDVLTAVAKLAEADRTNVNVITSLAVMYSKVEQKLSGVHRAKSEQLSRAIDFLTKAVVAAVFSGGVLLVSKVAGG